MPSATIQIEACNITGLYKIFMSSVLTLVFSSRSHPLLSYSGSQSSPKPRLVLRFIEQSKGQLGWHLDSTMGRLSAAFEVVQPDKTLGHWAASFFSPLPQELEK